MCLCGLLTIATGAFTWNHQAVLVDGSVYFVDGDCYARMTRVRLLLENPGSAIRSHNFENFPEGTRPHTTAPLDYLIAGLQQILQFFSAQSLELAGALISPLLGIITLLFLALWSRSTSIPFRWSMLFLIAVSPIISHGFLFGRPDHQSLLLFLTALALAAEVHIWQGEKRLWPVVSAAAWAFALWTSLFEPLILLGAVLFARLVRILFEQRSLAVLFYNCKRPLGTFFGILAIAGIWDGFRFSPFDPAFDRWALNIGELSHGNFEILFSWCGWILPLLPLFLVVQFMRKREPFCLAWAWLIGILCGLSLWHLRWGYFLALVAAMSLPWALPALRWKALAGAVFIASLWPIAQAWDRTLYPDDEALRARTEKIFDAVALRDAAMHLRDLPLRGVIAPWWFSPEVVWWSGQPCVGGSSHESLPGIVDSSKFYLATDFSEAEKILAQRRVGYVIAYEPERVISNAAQILGRKTPEKPLGETLYKHPNNTTNLRPFYRNRFFKVFQVTSQASRQEARQ